MTVEAHYPRLAINLFEEVQPQINALITTDLLDRIIAQGDMSDDAVTRNKLKHGLFEACKAYVDGAHDRAMQHSEKDDNEALDRVTNAAQRLYDALLFLQEHPGLEQQVEQSIRKKDNLHEMPNGVTLADMLGTGRNIFASYRETLVDLQICVEDVINRRPKPVTLEPLVESEVPIRLDSDEELQAGVRRWRERSRVRKFPKDHALAEFLASFKPTWLALSEHPFTEGMYYPETGSTNSRLVDAVAEVLKHLDQDVARSAIVNALRKFRSSQARRSSS